MSLAALSPLGTPGRPERPGVARRGFAPLPDALAMRRGAEIIPVVRFGMPTALAPGAARVGIKEGLTVLALALRECTAHWPASPQANERKIGAWKEANGEDKSALKKSEDDGRKGDIS